MSLSPEDRALLQRIESALDVLTPLLTGKRTLAQHARELGVSVSCIKQRRKAARIKALVKEVRV